MSLDNLNKWLTLVANFGVVAGIVLLAIEVRQNQALMQRQFDLQVVDSGQAIANVADQRRLLFAADSEVADIWLKGLEGELHSSTDKLRFDSLCDSQIWNDAIAYNRLRAIGRTVDAEIIPRGIKRRIETWDGYRKCWERNIGLSGVEAAPSVQDADSLH
jgi:hypothetical protein